MARELREIDVNVLHDSKGKRGKAKSALTTDYRNSEEQWLT